MGMADGARTLPCISVKSSMPLCHPGESRDLAVDMDA